MAEEHRLTGHNGSVLCARVFRGRLLFSGSVDGTVKVSLRRQMLDRAGLCRLVPTM